MISVNDLHQVPDQEMEPDNLGIFLLIAGNYIKRYNNAVSITNTSICKSQKVLPKW